MHTRFRFHEAHGDHQPLGIHSHSPCECLSLDHYRVMGTLRSDGGGVRCMLGDDGRQ
jgi:hypothetical protein